MSDRGWGTWSADRPAALVHPPSGLTVTPLLYSARAGAVSQIGMGPDLVLGARPRNDSSATFRVTHAGTTLTVRYGFNGPAATIDWWTDTYGEWGLRFWVVLCVSGAGALTYDPATGILSAPEAWLAVAAAKKPLMATFHRSIDAVTAELHEHGYFYLASRGTAGTVAALRFNLEEAPAMALSIAPGTPKRPPLPAVALPLAGASTEANGPLDAVHDVMAWNHVWDSVNDRPYTVLTRYWNTRKFGGFGVWLNDIVFNAMMWSPFDLARARENLAAVFAWQTEAGNFPCLITGNDAWLDRSQPPIVSYAVWTIAARHGDTALLEWAYDGLVRNHDWWWEKRSAGEAGLVVYGTSLDAGDGLYKGTKLAAKDESSMDNMAIHDPAPFDEATGLLMSYDVALNSLLALDGEVLAMIAETLGKSGDAARLTAASTTHKAAISTHLWDASRGIFANRLVGGGFVEPLAPTSFFPMVAGAATPEQVESLTRWLADPDMFGGFPGLPSAPRNQPAYQDNVYWRGRIWGPLNYWTYQGLARAGRTAEARALAAMSWRLFDEHGWQDRLCGENYNGATGEILDQSDTDPFYSWGALLPLMATGVAADVTPWDGLSLGAPLGDGVLGPVAIPAGTLRVAAGGGLIVDGPDLRITTTLSRLSDVVFEADAFEAMLPAGPTARFAVSGKTVASAALDDVPLGVGPDGAVMLPPRQTPARLVVRFSGI
ncbi:trehalase family glycosidase [Acuticoccus sp. MNP-M23]|uniref:MGH1-like glycoside hydrolase domain-containing protein n=1 Tax=Acuticoccus sp. MNP-M23 TaxID=3072793 RepID=UPI002814AC2F|nr:trehalase family glycosidase [Acuticoccus sp. MNP-M23]WMS43563.1 trehalase family glycosidase [Acuticoccus sp. MNP-M23]